MKALTIHQPWAQLIALGIKTIETRSWSTRHRGPIAIHAGASQKFIGIDYWSRLGQETGAAIHQALLDGGYGPSPAFPPYPKPGPDTIVGLPLGAIVATATLVDVLPMMDRHATDFVDGPLWAYAKDHGWVALNRHAHLNLPAAEMHRPPEAGAREGWTTDDISHLLPYGDFAPGRYAWLLHDIQPCEPIPAKGKQGLWTWQP